MTLNSGHPCVTVLDFTGKQLADGDADDSDFGLRAYLTKTFNLHSDSVDEQNGSEFYILGKQGFKAGDQVKASFGMYWSGDLGVEPANEALKARFTNGLDNLPNQSAYFLLEGKVKIDSSDPNYPDTTYLEVQSQSIQQIFENDFLQTLKWRVI